MELKSIVVTAADDPRYLDRLDLAFSLAKTHGAHVTVVHALPSPEEVPTTGRAASAAYIAARLETAREHGEALEKRTLEHAGARGCTVDWVSGSEGLHATIVHEALLGDLTVVGRSENSNFEDWFRDHLVDYLTRAVDCPVLYAPPTGDYSPECKSVMIAWDGSNPAMRAVRAALPILHSAAAVHVVSVQDGTDVPAQAGKSIVAYLARHGIKAELHGNESGGDGIAGALLTMADRLDADLIAMGAHSKPKLHEMLFGSVTRTLLTAATRPILLSG